MTDIVFTIGITTFNREAELKRNLINIAAVKTELIEAVYVVNQGAPISFSVSEILPCAILIEQKNLGGAGGFTRTMMSSLKALNCVRAPTHHIIMDDDAYVEAGMFENIATAAYEQPNKCFGGHMRFSEAPHIIAELGVEISKIGERSSVGRGLNVNSDEAKKLLSNGELVDAHAWWFWAVPISALKDADLPLPLFIKGDDIEYTYRCGSLGYPTIRLPDTYVHHPSIDKKGASWSYYYLARNNAIFCACNKSIKLPRYYAFFRLIAALLRHEYYRFELELKGLQHFLGGPSLFIEKNSDEIHHEITEFNHTLSKPVKRTKGAFKISHSGRAKKLNYLWALLLAPFYKSSDQSNFILDSYFPVDPIQCLGKGYEVLLSNETDVEVFPYDRKKFLSGFLKTLTMALTFAVKSQRVAKQWAEEKSTLTSEEYWNKQFQE